MANSTVPHKVTGDTFAAEEVNDMVTAINSKQDQITNTDSLTEGTTKLFWTTARITAALNNTALAGIPTAPTATLGTNTTQVATTAFVLANSGSTGAPVSVNIVPTTGSNNTIANQSNYKIWYIVNPTATIATCTITLPATPLDGQTVEISFGGTVTTGPVVTTVTISPNTSQAILQANTPGLVAAGEAVAYRWKAAVSKWYRIV